MARGWESKAIEDQQQEAQRDRSESRREASALDRRRTLELSRAQVVARLALARTDAHRKSLDRAIADLDEQLRSVDDAGRGAVE